MIAMLVLSLYALMFLGITVILPIVAVSECNRKIDEMENDE